MGLEHFACNHTAILGFFFTTALALFFFLLDIYGCADTIRRLSNARVQEKLTTKAPSTTKLMTQWVYSSPHKECAQHRH